MELKVRKSIYYSGLTNARPDESYILPLFQPVKCMNILYRNIYVAEVIVFCAMKYVLKFRR